MTTGPSCKLDIVEHAKVTEVGQLELSCLSRDGKEKFKLEFSVRERE